MIDPAISSSTNGATTLALADDAAAFEQGFDWVRGVPSSLPRHPPPPHPSFSPFHPKSYQYESRQLTSTPFPPLVKSAASLGYLLPGPERL